MKRKLTVLALILLACTMATPVLAGKGGGNSNTRSQHSGGSGSGSGAMKQSQPRHQNQNQYRHQTKQATEGSASTTRSQVRTRDQLTPASDAPVEAGNLTPQATVTE
ncbi:MAG: hypothetical protein QNK24_02170 [Desulfuromusa sp.]|nr:hypothetical protein [Desulfuromusa sp.]